LSIYTCAQCGREFTKWEAITRKRDGYHEHPDSYVRHLLDSLECNIADSIRRAKLRERYQPRDYDDFYPRDYDDFEY